MVFYIAFINIMYCFIFFRIRGLFRIKFIIGVEESAPCFIYKIQKSNLNTLDTGFYRVVEVFIVI